MCQRRYYILILQEWDYKHIMVNYDTIKITMTSVLSACLRKHFVYMQYKRRTKSAAFTEQKLKTTQRTWQSELSG